MEVDDENDAQEEIVDQSANALIDVLHSVHCDNSRLQYYAMHPDGGQISQMPLTPFVYEFFLFNSLYQIDWDKSDDMLVSHTEASLKEATKQNGFHSFLRQHARANPAILYRALEPLLHISRAEGEWTRVTPDSRISELEGEKFFARILKLQTLLEQIQKPSEFPTNNKIFDSLRECTRFVYLVRNNIFHGTKTLGDVREPNQKRRLEVYELLLKGITSLFFLAKGKHTAACDFVPCSISASSLMSNATGTAMSQSLILKATASGFMKVGDSRLVARFTKIMPPDSDITPSDKSSLFYPSAARDFITPILLGLPYCTQFYFYESHRSSPPPKIARILDKIEGVRTTSNWANCESGAQRDCLDFEFNGIPRRLHWVHADNTEIVEEDIELRFYFHRGDSWGEGGSGQEWDSKLLPKLLERIPSDSSCLYLTDGHPGGFDSQRASETFELNMPFIERGRTYYCGRFLA